MKYDILVVNYNTLKLTQDLVQNLLDQEYQDFRLILVDQNSSEPNTQEYLNTVSKNSKVTVKRNRQNVPLNKVWNDFVSNSEANIVSILNSDLKIPTNYTRDNFELMKDYSVDMILHATNHVNFSRVFKNQIYVFPDNSSLLHGWEFTLRRHLYPQIPDYLKFYCGDDYIFDKVDFRKIVYCLSSPVIHYQGQSKKSSYSKEKPSGTPDIQAYILNGGIHRRKIDDRYSKLKPEYKDFCYEQC